MPDSRTSQLRPLKMPYGEGDSNPVDNPRSHRSERRTALVARELARYKMDLDALSETRFSEQGQLEEVGAGYTFYWSARTKAEKRDAGGAFPIRKVIAGRLPGLPQGEPSHDGASICLWPATTEGVAGTDLLQLTLLGESGLAESS
ncbi:unnamed protein product [Schistocephalus solidus]|uniref:BHLH domain-containing protein n=1 Tax=Schistocephalus solidus TaxID=70667 RepID=A0A183TRU1_SCHSO|nr:unnamed protein product [Schistocephalus solidus]